jgi:hypothetical protein
MFQTLVSTLIQTVIEAQYGHYIWAFVRRYTFAQPVSQSDAGLDLNRQTHYGFRRTRSEMRDSEGKLVVESLVDHARARFARTIRPH